MFLQIFCLCKACRTRKKALETVSVPPKEEHLQTAISSAKEPHLPSPKLPLIALRGAGLSLPMWPTTKAFH